MGGEEAKVDVPPARDEISWRMINESDGEASTNQKTVGFAS